MGQKFFLNSHGEWVWCREDGDEIHLTEEEKEFLHNALEQVINDDVEFVSEADEEFIERDDI